MLVRTRKDDREGGVHYLPPRPANGEAATQSPDADIARYAAEVEAIDPNAWLPDGLPWLILYRAALARVIRNQEGPLEERPRTT